MITEIRQPSGIKELNGKQIKYYNDFGENVDKITIQSFGDEWKSFHEFPEEEIQRIGDSYFDIVPSGVLNQNTKAIDFGCGSGRWTKYIHTKVESIAAVDPSEAIFYASKVLENVNNAFLYKASIDNLPFADNYFDFGFSLGVLHHIPNTEKAMKDCVQKIRRGGHFLVYLYYSLDNRGFLFRKLFKVSNFFRKIISKMPARIKRFVCDVMAILFYMPFIMLSRGLKKIGIKKQFREKIPLHIYENASFYIIRNDSLDRFGTPLEQRFSKAQIMQMMKNCGLTEIEFSPNLPYWHAIGRKQ